MKQQHRGAVQDPIEDYLDTNRPNEKAAPVHPTKDSTRTAENQEFSPFPNESPITGQESVMTDNTSSRPPAGWTPERDEGGTVLYWDGPSATVGAAAIFTDWTPGQGVSIRDSNGHTIPLDDLVPFACQVLRVHSAVLHARREVAS